MNAGGAPNEEQQAQQNQHDLQNSMQQQYNMWFQYIHQNPEYAAQMQAQMSAMMTPEYKAQMQHFLSGQAGQGAGAQMQGNAADAVEDDEQPIYVNAKQYNRILKRRAARAEQDELMPRPNRTRKRGFMHESRHKHAKNRRRGKGGRFLTKAEREELEKQEAAAAAAAAPASSSGAVAESNTPLTAPVATATVADTEPFANAMHTTTADLNTSSTTADVPSSSDVVQANGSSVASKDTNGSYTST